MYSAEPNAARFREARERAGLSPDEAAALMGISGPSLWDIECYDGELTIYSPVEIKRFCEVLKITSQSLFGIESGERAVNAAELANLIRKHCLLQSITVEQFEAASGWSVGQNLDDPERFMHDYSIDGIQDICKELGVNWQRFVLSL